MAPPPPARAGPNGGTKMRPQEEDGGDVLQQLSRAPANMRCGGCGSKARSRALLSLNMYFGSTPRMKPLFHPKHQPNNP